MKRKLTAILSVVLIFVLCAALTACGSNSGDYGNLDGRYRMTEMTDGPLHITSDELDYEVVLDISGDSATLKGLSGSDVSSTIVVDAAAHTFQWEDGSITKFTVEGNKLTIDDGLKLVFEKQ